MNTFSRIWYSARVLVVCVGLMILFVGVNRNDGHGGRGGGRKPRGHYRQACDFFEQKILPVLESKCYSCHSSSSGRRRGGLALDSRNGVFAGGSSGPAVNTNEPAASILIHSLKGQDGYKPMPPQAALADSVIGDFETGLPWEGPIRALCVEAPVRRKGSPPRVKPSRSTANHCQPSRHRLPRSNSFDTGPAQLHRRADYGTAQGVGIEPAATCSDSVFVRRVYLDVIGTLPTAAEVRGLGRRQS